MPLRDIIGQPVAVRAVGGALGANRITHAFLFEGPGGVGKRTTALAFAQAVNCPQAVSGDGCGVCPACLRIAKMIDVDVRVFSTSYLGYKKPEAIEIRQEAYITPNTARRKFIIIDDADRMNAEAANLLLKILEEPPEFTVFVLLTENAQRVLPTIRSRTLPVSFRPLSLEDTVSAVAGRLSAREVGYLYPIAKGNTGAILQLSEDRGLKELFEDIQAELSERLLKPVPASPMRLSEEIAALAERLNVSDEDDSKSIAQRKSTISVLEIMMTAIERSFISTGAAEGSTMKLRSGCLLLETVLGTIKAIEGGAFTALALENMVISFASILEHKEKVS
ncbi:MAG TPA: AAA family ATPase [bacterium]|nr:AAA family ATPase [bacterium]